jgi:hypothetical protein
MMLVIAIVACLAFCLAVFGVGYGAHALWDWLRRGKSL